jgi:hypothetical protein
MKKKKKIARKIVRRLPAAERRIGDIRIRLNDAERKKLDSVCEETEMTISDIVRVRVLNLSEEEIEALRTGATFTTPSGTFLIQGLRKIRRDE